ncbi:four helix bundle protein [Zhaonella formicivorans]|uniref:four helix bundle protein n=1 Tax=Zhaonella formicivorans TaxID=2528593 RepID=UPI001D10DAF8|nr:four helix bundle protein [Zhaonella formicivorans]
MAKGSCICIIYEVTQQFPKAEMFGLVSQIRRAAVSIPANIAEGQVRQYDKEFIQFLHISKGSTAEVQYYLRLSYDLGYINDTQHKILDDYVEELFRLLNAFIGKLKADS